MPTPQQVPSINPETIEIDEQTSNIPSRIFKNRKKILITIIVLVVISFIYQLFGFIPYFSSSCPTGMIKERWTDYMDGTVKVESCMFPHPCLPGEELKAVCGPFPGYDICSLSCRGIYEPTPALKPVIYLYPRNTTDIKVRLDYHGKLIVDYPKYDEKIKGWNVTAHPDGTIIDKADNREYSYLFWEGMPETPIDWKMDRGFVVRGSEAMAFLQDTLPKIGLTPKEYNEFIVYWYPVLKNNPYNLIHFSTKQYTDTAPLDTLPKYDSMLRVFMVVKPLENPIKIEPQTFEKFERKGFTVIEWGGTILKQ